MVLDVHEKRVVIEQNEHIQNQTYPTANRNFVRQVIRLMNPEISWCSIICLFNTQGSGTKVGEKLQLLFWTKDRSVKIQGALMYFFNNDDRIAKNFQLPKNYNLFKLKAQQTELPGILQN